MSIRDIYMQRPCRIAKGIFMAGIRVSEAEMAERTIGDAAPDIMEYAAHLSTTIGPRPAGTEEEQKASFYIEGLMRDVAGLKTEIEEFRCNPNYELPRVVCCIVTAVLAVLSVILPLTIVPALIITLILGVLYAMELLGFNILGRLSKKGVSQNVVARYVPEQTPTQYDMQRTTAKRRRKIVLMAHYDTGKVRAELKGPLFGALNVIHWIELACMLVVPLVLLIRLALTAAGPALMVLNVIIIIAAIGAFLPVISYILHQTAQYNNGANCNAAGVSVMADVARRIGSDLANMDFGSDVVMHGEDALRQSGLIPEGADFSYNEGVSVMGDPSSPVEIMGADAAHIPSASAMEHELVATGQAFTPAVQSASSSGTIAGAAVGVASGVAVSGAGVDAIFEGIGKVPSTVDAIDIHQSSEVDLGQTTDIFGVPGGTEAVTESAVVSSVDGEGGDTAASTAVPAAPVAPVEDDGIPDWFKRGRQKAMENKSHEESGPTIVQRSRFADALDAAAASTAEAQAQANRAESAPSVAEQRLQQMRESIMEQSANAQNALRKSAQGDASSPSSSPAQSASVAPAPGDGAGAVEGASSVASAAASSGSPSLTQSHAGVGGYLSNTLSSPDYETAAAAQEAAAAANAAEVAAESAAEATVASATAAALATDAAEHAAAAKSRTAADRAAIASRTISFIPVAVDNSEINDLVQPPVSADAAAEDAAPSASPRAGIPQINATDGEAASGAEEHAASHKRGRRSISLPSLTGAIEGAAAKLQDAPIEDEAEPTEAEKRANRLARQEKLASSLPSTASASSRASAATTSGATGNVNVTAGAFIDASGTSSFAPVGDELIADVAEEDIYVEDADDSAYVEQITATGALAGPGYVDMPTSRTSRVFGRFRRKKKEEEISLKDSLGLDDSFDARSVGKARGGWESFRDDDAFDDDWNGGAFSKLRETASDGLGRIGGRKNNNDAAGDYADDGYYDEYEAYEQEYQDPYGDTFDEYASYDSYGEEPYEEHVEETAGKKRRSKRSDGNASGGRKSRSSRCSSSDESDHRTRKPIANPFGDLPLDFTAGSSEERQMIHQFRNGAISTEVWFVALGAELADNAGIKSFITEHSEDLRGSIIIDLSGLGAGNLSVLETEGMFRPTKVSSRLKRYANKAAQALGIRLESGKMLWRDSAAYVAAKRDYQTIHIAGMMNGKPAYSAQADDVFDNLSEEKMLQNSDYVLELIRSI